MSYSCTLGLGDLSLILVVLLFVFISWGRYNYWRGLQKVEHAVKPGQIPVDDLLMDDSLNIERLGPTVFLSLLRLLDDIQNARRKNRSHYVEICKLWEFVSKHSAMRYPAGDNDARIISVSATKVVVGLPKDKPGSVTVCAG